MHTDVYTLKTPLDTLSWLCLLESELLSIRAFQRLDLHTESDIVQCFSHENALRKENGSAGVPDAVPDDRHRGDLDPPFPDSFCILS